MGIVGWYTVRASSDAEATLSWRREWDDALLTLRGPNNAFSTYVFWLREKGKQSAQIWLSVATSIYPGTRLSYPLSCFSLVQDAFRSS